METIIYFLFQTFGYYQELSKPGELCLYHADLHSAQGDHEGTVGMPITDIAIANPTDKRVRLPMASTIVIGVNEIMPLEDNHHVEEEHMEEEAEHS